MQDLRGSWPCAWCDDIRVAKRGTLCGRCQLELDHRNQMARHDVAPQLLDEPAHPVRPWQDVRPQDRFL